MRKTVLRSLASLLLLPLILLLVNNNPIVTPEVYVHQEEYVPNEVLVKFKKDISKESIQEAINYVQGEIITYLGKEISPFQWDPADLPLRSFRLDPDLFHIKVPEAIGTEEAISVLLKNPNVKYAEKNGIVHAVITPLDTYFNELWGLHNTGQAGGTVDADIDAPEAWDIFTGSSDIVVAVIDSGVDYNHIDLTPNIWINPGESGNGKETDGIDNDDNDYIDDFRGWNFVSNNNNPMDDWSPYYHGTHVAGTIGAKGNNEEGVTGVNWNVKIMVLKNLNAGGSGNWANAVHAIDYSTENGAHLSNNSWGDYADTPSQILYDAITRARNAGRLFIAAAGNDGKNTDIEKFYPSCYPHANIISVAATTNKDELAPLSNYGLSTVDLGAPGGYWEEPGEPFNDDDIYSTKRYNDYQFLCGTSMATPHVAGVAALVWGYRPGIDYQSVKNVIMNGVDPKSSLSGKTVTGGRLNAYNALDLASNIPEEPSNLRARGYCWEVKLTWQDNSDNEDGFKIYRRSGTEYYYIRRVGPNITTYWDIELYCGQHWCYKVRAYNQIGKSAFSNAGCDRTERCSQCGYPMSLKIVPDKETINPDELVTYIYELENKGNVDLTGIELIDDKFGKIAIKFTLKKGERKTFTKTVILTETTTNFAEATAIYHYENKTEIIKSHANAIVEVRK